MKWLLGTYTQRFNLRRKHWGHLFGGRYKAQLIDERSASYLVRVCNYVHLNPVRARMVGRDKKLQSFKWSSYPAYLTPSPTGCEWIGFWASTGCSETPPPRDGNLKDEWSG